MAPILGIIRAVDRKILRVRMKNEINLEKKIIEVDDDFSPYRYVQNI